MKVGYLVTCEHASGAIPKEYQQYFAGHEDLLKTHRGLDIGAIDVYQALVQSLTCEHQAASWSRLLVDLNRTPRQKTLFSPFILALSKSERAYILKTYYESYAEGIRDRLDRLKQYDRIIHLAIHSFTPELNGIVRQADIGILYDSRYALDQHYAETWQHAFQRVAPHLRVRRNYPYHGRSPGLLPRVRKWCGNHPEYAGLELEVNQALLQDSASRDAVIQAVVDSVKAWAH